jgi:tripartite-type tricarboxylate transporter receptor subunit TctC
MRELAIRNNKSKFAKPYPRRAILVAGALALALVLSAAALAQGGYPNKPIRILVGFTPGGNSDIISRVVGNKMGEILGAQVVVENKPGAGGAIATDAAARSAPDGYTLLNTPLATAVIETLSKTIRYEFGKDIVAVGPQAETANILVVHASLGVKSVAELVALAKSKPGEIQYATAGRGSATHLNHELFDMVAGIKTIPVHYRGGSEALKDLVSGQVTMMFPAVSAARELVKGGRLIALATTGPRRDPAFPELPTVAESGYPGFDVRLWMGLTAPAGTPRDIIKRLEEANRKALESPEIQKTLASQGFAPLIGTSEQFDTFYRSERDKWAKVIKASSMDKE